ncbi:hypothetical protein COV19_06655 [Candidatus Woesearchaeota archaeon CG10_big_fil_rev_8_21_14_0_10_44_13]|nr:MAG: hypothetical protein COV19_06655 [Candidatus Woesearchaeota archaeon CG10_big_fil_rev_8_21_14_0_10_44_13]
MGKKCIICGQEAKFSIKDSSEFYCQDCAEEQFGDLDMLVKVEEEAQKLKAAIEENLRLDKQ